MPNNILEWALCFHLFSVFNFFQLKQFNEYVLGYWNFTFRRYNKFPINFIGCSVDVRLTPLNTVALVFSQTLHWKSKMLPRSRVCFIFSDLQIKAYCNEIHAVTKLSFVSKDNAIYYRTDCCYVEHLTES